MKRILFAGLLLFFSFGVPSFSQQSSPYGDPDYLFHMAIEQFNQEEYSGCFRSIETWIQESPSSAHMEETLFMRAASSYQLNRRETSLLLIDFLKTYPASPYSEKAYYLLGCSAMNAEQYQDAIDFFKCCPESALKEKEIPDYRFRYAYVSMQLGDYNTSKKLFTEIANQNSRYSASARYFCTYMDYSDHKTKEASEGFKKFAGEERFKNALPVFSVQLHYAEGKTITAISEARTLLSGNSIEPIQRTELTRLMAAASFDIKDYDNAGKYYDSYLGEKPREVHNSDKYRIGVIYYLNSDYNKAENYLSGLDSLNDALGQSAAYHLGMVNLKKGNNDLAKSEFEKASISDFDRSTKEKAMYNYALTCYNNASFDDQVSAFTNLIKEFPESALTDSSKCYLADILLENEDYTKSLSIIDNITNPGNELLQTKSRLLFLLGTGQMKENNPEEALKYFNNSISVAESVSQTVPETYYWRGEAHYQLKNYSKAYRDYKRFVDSKGSQSMNAWQSALYNLGYCCFYAKNYTEAEKWFAKFTSTKGNEKDKRYADAFNRSGDCLFMVKNYEKAGKMYEEADKNTVGGNDYATFQKAFLFGLRKRYQAKLDLLENFGSRFPESQYADDALFESGKTCSLLKQDSKAVSYFSSLMEKYPDSPLSRKAGIQIALIYYNGGNSDKAAEAYKEVISKYPDSEEAKTALNDLKMINISNNTVSDYISYTKKHLGGSAVESTEEDSLTYLAAENLMMDGKTADAQKGFEDYITKFPSGKFATDCHFNLGKMLLSSNKDEALNHLKYVAESSDSRYKAETVENLSEICFSDKNYEEALKYFTQLEAVATSDNTKTEAIIGKLRCQYNLKKYNDAATSATTVIQTDSIDPDILQEVRYYRAKSYLEINKANSAKADLQALSSEVQSEKGAESRYLLAELYFNNGSLEESNKVIQKFIQEGTPHSYWLAKSFILLSDIKTKQKKYFEAKQYLQSLKESYHADDEISGMIETRLKKLEEKK